MLTYVTVQYNYTRMYVLVLNVDSLLVATANKIQELECDWLSVHITTATACFLVSKVVGHAFRTYHS